MNLRKTVLIVLPAPSFSLLAMVLMVHVGHLININLCRSGYHVSIVPHLVQLEYLTKEQRIVFLDMYSEKKEEFLEFKMSCSCQDDDI